MNYRHAFHAGNFADLVKHAALLQLLARLPRPLSVVDTHAGRGLYDLAGAEAQKSGEAQAGIVRLMAAEDAPAAFAPLKAAVGALNGAGQIRRYPGSPLLTVDALGGHGRYLGCELRESEHAALRAVLKGRAGVETRIADGYDTAMAAAPRQGPGLVLIDPPFERADDYGRIVETIAAVRRNPALSVLAWLPLKDLATFDAFLGDLEDLGQPVLVSETRLRPLDDPLKMNGCALVLAGAASGMAGPMQDSAAWCASVLGDGGGARTYAL